ncbi:glycosyltransferase family 2 protein [Marinicauda pacifica]|uniref:glycosyltransferase family 2 protein n=1 Tax=Marinicauda pacifica TaxID=1133559 RepID=UPI0035C800F1
MSQILQSDGEGTDPAVTVIIVAYNAGRFLQPCVDALARQDFTRFDAVIVDNSSSDEAVETLRLPDARFRIDRAGENLGFAAGNNRVAMAAGTPWIATLNPDTEPDPDWLSALMDATVRWDGVAGFGSTQVKLDDPDILDGVGDVWHAAGLGWRALEGRPVTDAPGEGESFAVCAAGALYATEAFQAIGGFDERFFCYCEDLDLAYRLRSRGWSLVQVPDAILRHAGSGTTGRHSAFTVFHGHRNRIWTFVKNTPGWLFWLMLPAHIAVNLRMLLRTPTPDYRRDLIAAYKAAWTGLGPVWQDRRIEQRQRTTPTGVLARMMAWRPRLITERGVVTGRDGKRRRMGARRVV